MVFHEKWVNWVLETIDEECIAKIGRRCYQDSQWVKQRGTVLFATTVF